MAVDSLRSFFAIPLSHRAESELDIACDSLQAILEQSLNPEAQLRWVPPGNYHLTLAFLGTIRRGDIARLHDIACQVIDGMWADEFTLRRFDWMPSALKPRLLVAEPEPCSTLIDLQGRLSKALRQQGFSLEKREFRPHITLARLRDVSACPDLSQESVAIACELDELVLFSSERGREGSVYSPLVVEPIG